MLRGCVRIVKNVQKRPYTTNTGGSGSSPSRSITRRYIRPAGVFLTLLAGGAIAGFGYQHMMQENIDPLFEVSTRRDIELSDLIADSTPRLELCQETEQVFPQNTNGTVQNFSPSFRVSPGAAKVAREAAWGSSSSRVPVFREREEKNSKAESADQVTPPEPVVDQTISTPMDDPVEFLVYFGIPILLTISYFVAARAS